MWCNQVPLSYTPFDRAQKELSKPCFDSVFPAYHPDLAKNGGQNAY
jgi:hypothetical protein